MLEQMSASSLSPAAVEACLQERFGLSAFREGQRDVIEAVLAARPTLAVMPTGRGKSLCYQLPALLLPGVTLVVSPLIALMKDQVDALGERGIAATYINSALGPDEQRERLDAMREGAYKLVYVAPERFRQRAFVQALATVNVSLLAIDEAHCLSQWGHDFRPDYLKLKAAVAACKHPTVLAATATATPEVRDDIIGQLGLVDPRVVVSGFDRPNLRLVVRYAPNDEAKLSKLDEILDKIRGTAIVYAATRRNVEAVTAHLTARGVRAVAYHAGLQDGERHRAQERFMSGAARVVVATNAFGMGIDKSDVRVVVHYDLPGTVEAYYQEAGRAGRDGNTSFCVLLFSPADRYLQEFFIEGNCPRPETVAGVFRALAERPEAEIFLGHEAINRLLPAKVHPMAVGTALHLLERHGLIERLGQGAAPAHVRLAASTAAPLRSPLQQRLWTHLAGLAGAAEGVSLALEALAETLGERREDLHAGLTALREKGLIDYAPPGRTAGYRVLDRTSDALSRLDLSFLATKQAREMAKLERMIGFAYARTCRRDELLMYFGEATSAPCGRCDVCNGQVDPALGDEAGETFFDELRALRNKLARELDVPAYKIFPDATLREMASALPETPKALLALKGVGPEKLTRHGTEFLAAIAAFRARHPNARPAAPSDAEAPEPTDTLERRVAALAREGFSVAEMAERCLKSPKAIDRVLEALAAAGRLELESVLTSEVRRAVLDAAAEAGMSLPALRRALPETVSALEIRLAVASAPTRPAYTEF